MNTLVKVARYQLTNRLGFVILPWAILALDFVINLVIFTDTPAAGQVSPATRARWPASTSSSSSPGR